MKALYTIGYTKKDLREFIRRLKGHGVDCVVDIRLHNTSQLAGFSKKEDLEFLLRDGFGINYVHMPELAPSEEIFNSLKRNKDWESYRDSYRALIEERGMVDLFLKAADENNWEGPCLLCAEDTSEHCHRRMLAEAIQENVEGLEVMHI